MFVVVATVLAFLGDWRDGDARMQPLEGLANPLEVGVATFDCFGERGRVDEVGDVGLFEHTSFFLLELSDEDL